jgi:NADPH-dependent 2,4-dienoyl-CoA reductase/sulfur reductase-like enzyme
MRLVIIGGDAAGMSAASQARRVDGDAEVVVLEKTHDVSYGACGLPYKLPDGERMEDLQAISAAQFRRERGIDVRLGWEVQAIDPHGRVVRGEGATGSFELGYDRLVIATGARVARPPIPGLEALWGESAFPLKTLADGRALKRALAARPPDHVVVIGGGYIGLEATEGLHALGCRVTILEALPQILPYLPSAMVERVYAEAERNEVTIRTDTRVGGIDREPSGTLRVRTSGGDLRADTILVATGVRPESALAAEAGLALGAADSIAVDPLLRTSQPDIYAAGDCADAIHALTGRSVWIPLALRANRAGKLAGANACGQTRRAPPVLGTAVFKFFGLEIARTGLSEAEAAEAGFETVSAMIVSATRAGYYPGGGKLHVWLLADRRDRRVLGGAMVGPEGAAHKIDTLAAALHAGMSAEQVYDLDLAYAPPFGPSWSPLLIAASQLGHALDR